MTSTRIRAQTKNEKAWVDRPWSPNIYDRLYSDQTLPESLYTSTDSTNCEKSIFAAADDDGGGDFSACVSAAAASDFEGKHEATRFFRNSTPVIKLSKKLDSERESAALRLRHSQVVSIHPSLVTRDVKHNQSIDQSPCARYLFLPLPLLLRLMRLSLRSWMCLQVFGELDGETRDCHHSFFLLKELR